MNILTPFEYFRPETLDEALELLATKENAKVLAGGTDLEPAALAGLHTDPGPVCRRLSGQPGRPR